MPSTRRRAPLRAVLLLPLLSSSCALFPGPSESPDAPSSTASASPSPEAPPAIPPEICVLRTPQTPKDLGLSPEDVAHGSYDGLTDAGQARAQAVAAELPAGIAEIWLSPEAASVHAGHLLGLSSPARPEAMVRRLDGWIDAAERLRAAEAGVDLTADDAEGFEQAAARAAHVIDQARDRVGESGRILVITPGDFAPVLIGAALGTPPLERPRTHALEPGTFRCVPLPVPPVSPAPPVDE